MRLIDADLQLIRVSPRARRKFNLTNCTGTGNAFREMSKRNDNDEIHQILL